MLKNCIAATIVLAIAFCLAPATAVVNDPTPPQSSYGLSSPPPPSVDKPVEVKDSFRRTLIKAAQKAASEGKISRRDAIRIRVASFSPAFLEQAEELCVVQMVFSGENQEDIPRNASGDVDRTAIDWEGFAAFLERIIPLIVQLLISFGLGAA